MEKRMIVTARGMICSDMLAVIEKRDQLIIEADHLVNIALDNDLDVVPFRQYRQALRDIPQTYQNAGDVVWPQKPSLQSA